MDHFYVTLSSDSSGYYFARNTIANFRNKLATPIKLESDKWEVRLVEITQMIQEAPAKQYHTFRFDINQVSQKTLRICI